MFQKQPLYMCPFLKENFGEFIGVSFSLGFLVLTHLCSSLFPAARKYRYSSHLQLEANLTLLKLETEGLV